jgi:hypothetical protein
VPSGSISKTSIAVRGGALYSDGAILINVNYIKIKKAAAKIMQQL